MKTTKCRHCGKQIASVGANRKPRVVCSTRCGALSRPYPVEDRFWARVRKSDGCWEWVGRIASTGYGVISIHNRPRNAHRVSWELHHGAISDGLWVLHHCDNRKCVRPDHLYLGTVKENARDMVARGRMCRGEQHHSARLTWASVHEIRRRHAAGESAASLAREFGVSGVAARRVVRGETWLGQQTLERAA